MLQVFDVNWNPSYDEQAQDRSFRIGQNRDVKVVRLVSQGTIEELMYARQIYKTHLKRQSLGGNGIDATNDAGPRMFRGVVGDKNRKGELFGLENLLKYKEGSFMDDMWKAKGGSNEENKGESNRMHNVNTVLNVLSSLTEEQINSLGDGTEDANSWISSNSYKEQLPNDNGKCANASRTNLIDKPRESILENAAIHHDDFLKKDRGDALLKLGDEGFEEELGGESQIVHVTSKMACEAINDAGEEHVDLKPNEPLTSVKTSEEHLSESTHSMTRDRAVAPKACLDIVSCFEDNIFERAKSVDKGTLDSYKRTEDNCADGGDMHSHLSANRNERISPSSADKPGIFPSDPAKLSIMGKVYSGNSNTEQGRGLLYVPSYTKKKRKRGRTKAL